MTATCCSQVVFFHETLRSGLKQLEVRRVSVQGSQRSGFGRLVNTPNEERPTQVTPGVQSSRVRDEFGTSRSTPRAEEYARGFSVSAWAAHAPTNGRNFYYTF